METSYEQIFNEQGRICPSFHIVKHFSHLQAA
jgi:hypothetical protein